METVNGTCANSLKEHLLATRAHVVCAQEVKTWGETTATFSEWCERRGWKAIISDGKFSSETKRTRAGTAVIVRDWCGLRRPNPEDQKSSCLADGRATAAIVEAPGTPAMFVGSVYLEDGHSPKEGANPLILREIGAAALKWGGPFALAGDFQNCPAEMEEAGFPQLLQATVMADESGQGTYVNGGHRSNIDYWVLSDDLAEATEEKKIALDSPVALHRPFALFFKARLAKLTKWTVVKPPQLPRRQAIGPVAPKRAGAWEKARETANAALTAARSEKNERKIRAALSRAYKAFAKEAEDDIIRKTQADREKAGKRGQAPRLVQVPLFAERLGGKTLSGARVAYTWMARRAREAIHDAARAARGDEAAQCRVEQELTGESIQPPEWFEEKEEWCEAFRRLQRTVRQVLKQAGKDDEDISEKVEEAQEEAEDLEAAAKAAEDGAEDGWKIWANAALEGGASKAHTWSKGPRPWCPAQVRKECKSEEGQPGTAKKPRETTLANATGSGDQSTLCGADWRLVCPEGKRDEEQPEQHSGEREKRKRAALATGLGETEAGKNKEASAEKETECPQPPGRYATCGWCAQVARPPQKNCDQCRR